MATPIGSLPTGTPSTDDYLVFVDNADSTTKKSPVSSLPFAQSTSPLSQFASTTSSELAGVISDETGSGALVFGTSPTLNSPTLTTPILGTPTSGTLTNCTGLPVAGITSSTSTALGVGTLEVGHATDTTLSRVSAGVLAVEGVNVVTTSSTDTLTNKTMTGATNIVTARLLKSATTEIDVSSATAPTSGQVLTATSPTTATWQTPSGGSFIGCRIYKSAGQSIGTTLTAITFDTESFNTNTMHDNVTNNSRVTFTTAGYYQVNALLTTQANAISRIQVRLNGSTIIYANSCGNGGASLDNGVNGNFIYQFSATDYIEILGYFGTTQTSTSGTSGTQVSVVKVG